MDDHSIEMFAPNGVDGFEDIEDWAWASPGTSLQGGRGQPLLLADLADDPPPSSTPRRSRRAPAPKDEEGTWNPLHIPPGMASADPDDAVINPQRRPSGKAASERGIVFGVTRRDAFGNRRLHKVVVPDAQTLNGLGITLKGDGPVFVAAVEAIGPAFAAGLRANDCFVTINGTACAAAAHSVVVDLVARAVAQSQANARRAVHQPNPLGPGRPMVVLPGEAQPDASLSDVTVSVPPTHTHARSADPYGPIRDAASHHQLEAARLMQEGHFKQAKVLLDKAIELLSSIPRDPADDSTQMLTLRSVAEATAGPAPVPRTRSFVPLQRGARVVVGKKLPKRHGKLRGRENFAQVTVVTAETRELIPRVSFRPIKPARSERAKRTKPKTPLEKGAGHGTRESRHARPSGPPGSAKGVRSSGSSRHAPEASASRRGHSEQKSVRPLEQPPLNGQRVQAWGDAHSPQRQRRSRSHKDTALHRSNDFVGFEIEAGEDNVVTSKIIRRENSGAYLGFNVEVPVQ